MICRIFPKSWEEEEWHPTRTKLSLWILLISHRILAPLPKPQTKSVKFQSRNPNSVEALQNYHQQPENDLKSLIINPVESQSHSHDLFQATSEFTVFKSLHSHQDFTLKELHTTIPPRQCKKDANFSHFQLLEKEKNTPKPISKSPVFWDGL